jgi:hypothetical protein
MRSRIAVLMVAAACFAVQASEPDWEREARLAAEIVDVIFDGEPEWLSADGRDFLSIYTEADSPRAGVIIMHGRGFHPDWADTVAPLRVGLVEYGFSTLSLQMPVLAKDARYYDYVPIFPAAFPRIEAAIRFLREAGYERVYLIAHSCSVHMVMAWIRAHPDAAFGNSGFDAFVGLGMGATDYGQPMREPFPLESMPVPVLDLYGGDEYPAVVRGAPQRLAQIERAGVTGSKQIVLPDANHYFTNRGEALVEEVAAWLLSLQ